MPERLGIVGAGTIARGLARVAAEHGDVVLWARSESSKAAAEEHLDAHSERSSVDVTTDLDSLAKSASFIVEAISEDAEAKHALLRELGARADEDTILATTTSSRPIGELAVSTGIPHRFVGLHVFNPVHRMPLVELVFPPDADRDTRLRARELCEHLGKTAVEVPDIPGFVVNRLLFPYLFSAVRLQEETGLPPESVDACMKLGAGHPMGPLALLDLVGLDVSIAIGETIGADIPERLTALAAEGALGRKSGRGFYSYGD